MPLELHTSVELRLRLELGRRYVEIGDDHYRLAATARLERLD